MRPRTSLQQAIYDLHGCASTRIETVQVIERFQGQTVWDGTVEVFNLNGHPTATRCYAWSHETDEGKLRHVAVLHQGPVDSPSAAVRAAIVQEYHGS